FYLFFFFFFFSSRRRHTRFSRDWSSDVCSSDLEKDLSEFVFAEIESWIDANPINHGPNWRCSQEISLRVFNWCFALYYYQNAERSEERRVGKECRSRWLSVH